MCRRAGPETESAEDKAEREEQEKYKVKVETAAEKADETGKRPKGRLLKSLVNFGRTHPDVDVAAELAKEQEKKENERQAYAHAQEADPATAAEKEKEPAKEAEKGASSVCENCDDNVATVSCEVCVALLLSFVRSFWLIVVH